MDFIGTSSTAEIARLNCLRVAQVLMKHLQFNGIHFATHCLPDILNPSTSLFKKTYKG